MQKIKIVQKIIGLLLVVVLFASTYSCDVDAVTIDPNLELPPVLLSTDGWEVAVFTSQEDMNGEGENNGRVWNAIDGNPNTFWHSCWNNCTPVPPHNFVIDMTTTQTFKGFFITQRQSLSRNIERFSIEISDDNSSWTSLGEHSLERVRPAQQLALDAEVSARYFRFNVISVYDGTANAALAEIAPYF